MKDSAAGELHENMVRKDFTVSEMVAIKPAVEPEVRAESRGRQGTRTDLGQELRGNFPQGKTRDIVASFVSISGRTIEKAEAIVDAYEKNPNRLQSLMNRVDSGKTSINYAYKMVKRINDQTQTPPLPDRSIDRCPME